jgi:hypothetical protein
MGYQNARLRTKRAEDLKSEVALPKRDERRYTVSGLEFLDNSKD